MDGHKRSLFTGKLFIFSLQAVFCCFLLYFTLNRMVHAAEGWSFEVAPYLWAINLNGNVGIGEEQAHVSQSFSDVLKHFDGGGMLWIDAHHDRFGLFFNGVYAALSDNAQIDHLPITMKNKFGIGSAGISYIVFDKKPFNSPYPTPGETIVEPYLGVRYTLNDTTLNIDSFSVSNNQHWYDPILGAKVRYNINREWHSLIAGDLGGISNNHYSYNFNALLGYQSTRYLRCATFYLGYHYLYQYYLKKC